jgi:hypothetical protein
MYLRSRNSLSRSMTARARRTAVTTLALLGAALPAAAASAQVPPPLPGGVGGLPPVLTQPPLLTPFPGPAGPTIRQFDCRTIWVRAIDPPHKPEQVTFCRGWEIVP